MNSLSCNLHYMPCPNIGRNPIKNPVMQKGLFGSHTLIWFPFNTLLNKIYKLGIRTIFQRPFEGQSLGEPIFLNGLDYSTFKVIIEKPFPP